MKKILTIVGPTATGKTDIALMLAKKINGELISCDSRQVYKHLDIGSGKMPSAAASRIEKKLGYWVIDGVPVRLYDVTDVKSRYSVNEYIKDAKGAIDYIVCNDRLPVIVGGTGLYLKGLFKGIDTLNIREDNKLRRELENKTLAEVQNVLKDLNPNLFEQLNLSEKGNKRRLIRKIEILKKRFHQAEKSVDFGQNSNLGIEGKFNILKIGLSAPREKLNQRINERVEKRSLEGMVEEVEGLIAQGVSKERLKELGLEYRIITEFLEGKYPTQRACLEVLKIKIHQFAKRQITWFRKEENIEWFDITSDGFLVNLEKKVSLWYHRGDEQKN